MQFMEICKSNNVKHFIYASSGSVYGISQSEKVTEQETLVPISEYNRTKMVAEKITEHYRDVMKVQIIRPATICGVSRRMRFDVVVNMLCLQAFKFQEITVLGGEQTRPNIHIDDMCKVYQYLIENPAIPGGVYNAGFENLAVGEIARMISTLTNSRVVIKDSNDPRSYRLDSSKLLSLGFKPDKNVSMAINEVLDALKEGRVQDKLEFHTVQYMKRYNIGIEGIQHEQRS